MEILKITTCQAPNADPFAHAVAQYLAQQLPMPVEFITGIPWQERAARLDAGDIHISWICGLPYALKVDRPDPLVHLLAAPVMSAPRYQNRPIYFSDVVVRADSPFQNFADLEGATWAYNEPLSQSGYNVTRYHLATMGKVNGYFQQAVEAGAHQDSLKMVMDGDMDASAIDSTVLETELQSSRVLPKDIRIISTLGPSPIPPWVVHHKVPAFLRHIIQSILINMHLENAGKSILQAAQVSHFTSVTDSDYNPIRHMATLAANVSLC
jgi:phosphonate transport system substrate-binding protein